jgi:hypothetical protein
MLAAVGIRIASFWIMRKNDLTNSLMIIIFIHRQGGGDGWFLLLPPSANPPLGKDFLLVTLFLMN